MARAVEWAGRAKSDLRLAVEYIRNDSPESAKAFLSQVFQAARSLSTFSERGRLVPDLGDPAVRQVLVGRYRSRICHRAQSRGEIKRPPAPPSAVTEAHVSPEEARDAVRKAQRILEAGRETSPEPFAP